MKTKKSILNNKVDDFPKRRPVIHRPAVETIKNVLPEILFISSFPPRECGIATFSQDLIKSLNNKFNTSFSIEICALESEKEKYNYEEKIKYILNTDCPESFSNLAVSINANVDIKMVLIQHEFGFYKNRETNFLAFLESVIKPLILSFHTVLPHPDEALKLNVQKISASAEYVIVMTQNSAKILMNDYGILSEKIIVIAHGTHLVPHEDRMTLKEKYKLSDKKVLATFGLLSSGKGIETSLEALPAIVKVHPDVLFLIIGKTHPNVVNHEGEIYRNMLLSKVTELKMERHVQFINYFMPLDELLEYLQLTDIYLFTSKDPNQAVSGTFSYAISCGCPVISTPMPHACEVLKDNAGIIIDFNNPAQLSAAVIGLLNDEPRRKNISSNGLHRIASTAWENSAIAHTQIFAKAENSNITLKYKLPSINLEHFRKLTTDFGMLQFSKINKPDIESGYTLDDNARAMIAMCQYIRLKKDVSLIKDIYTYLNFIKYCQQPDGSFLNYVDKEGKFTAQNTQTSLEDANGRAIWALGYLISIGDLLPADFRHKAIQIVEKAKASVYNIHSTRAMAFTIKGIHYLNIKIKSDDNIAIIKVFADRLLQMFRHEADRDWQWFESYLTYANSILAEAMLCAYLSTGDNTYRETAMKAFDFLLSKTFIKNAIKVISNKTWLHKGTQHPTSSSGGEQPIDVAYTIIALSKFYDVFKETDYLLKMETAFNWFLGNNHLHQIIYNPCTGGCYDGLENNYVNLNQGAESTLSYLMARLTVEKYSDSQLARVSHKGKLKIEKQLV